MQAKPLSAELRELRDVFRRYVASHQRPSIDACRELTVAFSLMAEEADRIEARAADAEEMEAIARDLDIVASAAVSPSLQEALKREQRAVQADLDGGGDLDLPRPGLATLALLVGDTNVVTFPVCPRPRPIVGDGGSAA